MLCEKVLGNLKEDRFRNLRIDYVDFEWHETYKKLHRKRTHSGVEVGIRFDNDILLNGVKQDDVIYVDENTVVAANILPCESIVIDIDKNHEHMIAKVCYEIGNKHASLFRGENYLQFITPYNEPTKVLLEKLHGVKVQVKEVKFDFMKSVSSTVNNHTH
ncbi:urease accessory protein UreE [Clostridium sp. SHJSY1]|uniref:urease accessory protein UreE n=1 Tax=Clostridium sp. SHJSY1 TaxID=2942483 RepID=UPI002873FD33|nr:urease accessory protein UreE [Clostridium sp. SHJSY1]MDS0527458.1 urease accessory protein UreE [Clostridium sp. SHJSY1]